MFRRPFPDQKLYVVSAEQAIAENLCPNLGNSEAVLICLFEGL